MSGLRTTDFAEARSLPSVVRTMIQMDTEHERVRPMAASKEAMEDLKGILVGRAAFYSKADMRLDTSAAPLQPTFLALREMVRKSLQLAA